jgi:hypothetical protein
MSDSTEWHDQGNGVWHKDAANWDAYADRWLGGTWYAMISHKEFSYERQFTKFDLPNREAAIQAADELLAKEEHRD